jgi:peptidoglycan/xylan/chitin deacetylase (PgdA/CDA1 family)
MKAHLIKLPKYAAINIFLVLLIIGIYIVASDDSIRATFNNAAGFPIYQGRHDLDKAALECCVDGSANDVEKMLDILKENKAKMTFFISASWAKENKDLITRMTNEGHEMGILGKDYKTAGNFGVEDVKKDVTYTASIIQELSGANAALYSPFEIEPDGRVMNPVLSTGFKVVLCTRNTFSSGKDNAGEIYAKAIKNAGNGDLIMLYPCDGTVEALPRIIMQLRKQGLELDTVGNLIEK